MKFVEHVKRESSKFVKTLGPRPHAKAMREYGLRPREIRTLQVGSVGPTSAGQGWAELKEVTAATAGAASVHEKERDDSLRVMCSIKKR